MFVSIAAGLSIEFVLYKDEGSSSDSYSSNDEFSHSETIGNLFFRGEIGKDWWFSKRWSFGAAINYSFGKFSDDYNNESDVFLNHVIGLTIRITH